MFLLLLGVAAAALNRSAEIIVVASHPRSGSTELVNAIAKENSGILQLGECLNRGNSTRPHVLEEFVGAEAYEKRCEKPLETLLAAQRSFCGNRTECAVVTKVFPEHCYDSPDWYDDIAKILLYQGTRTIVLERNPAESECSLTWAQLTGDWGTAPDKHTVERPPCPPQASEDYVDYHNRWFNFIRHTLADAGRVHLEVPFRAYANTDLKIVGSEAVSFAGFRTRRRRR